MLLRQKYYEHINSCSLWHCSLTLVSKIVFSRSTKGEITKWWSYVSSVTNKQTLCRNKHSALPSHFSPTPIISSSEFRCRLPGNDISRPVTLLVNYRLNTFPGKNAPFPNSVSQYLPLCYLQPCEISKFSTYVVTLVRAKRIVVLKND